MRRRQLVVPPATPLPPVAGRVIVHRAHLLLPPSYRLATEQGLEVGLGRYSALNIYFFGRGQKVSLPRGGPWRLTAVARGSGLTAVMIDETRHRLAMATPGAVAGNYGINGRDYAYTLNPAEGRLGRARIWDLFDGEEVVARFTRRPFGAFCHRPIPLATVLLALQLVRFGIPGENELRLPGMWQLMSRR